MKKLSLFTFGTFLGIILAFTIPIASAHNEDLLLMKIKQLERKIFELDTKIETKVNELQKSLNQIAISSAITDLRIALDQKLDTTKITTLRKEFLIQNLTTLIYSNFLENFDETAYKAISMIVSNSLTIFNNNLYLFFETAHSWEEAKAICESLGGHLLVINNLAERTFINNFLAEKNVDKNINVWIGLSRYRNDLTLDQNKLLPREYWQWRWIDGTLLLGEVINWDLRSHNTPEPNNAENSGEFYVQILNNTSEKFWNDGVAGTKCFFICELDSL